MAKRKIIFEIVLLSLVAISLAFIINFLSPRGIALFGDWDKSKGMVSANARADSIGRKYEIELPEALILYKKGVLFVDARTEDIYKQGHIKGAVSLSVEKFFDKIQEFKQKYPESTPILTYCSGRECSDSHDLAENLVNAGYTDVRIFIDGYPAWDSEKNPVEK